MHRGEIWWAELPDTEGSAPAHRRPVLIVQANAFNRSRISTVVALALTSNLRLAEAPGNVLLPAKHTDLPKDSVAHVSQLVTLDRDCLTHCVGVLPNRLLAKIEYGLRLVLDL